ncbi:MAG: membrane protein [Patescibacteria group bacterium]|nr:MAG: membrane protein [Patescibacteria group bacterium]
MKLLMRLIINVFALYVVEYLVPGFRLENIWAATVAAIVIGIVNTFIRPVLQIITLPISIVTFGLFSLLINVGLLYLASFVVPGFEIANFLTAFVASIVLSLVSWFLGHLAKD